MSLALIGTLLMTGLLGSGHCLVMCGGISASLGGAMPGSAAMQRWQQFWMHLGRVLSYATLGMAAAALGTGVFEATRFGSVLRPLWVAGNVLALVAGLSLLFRARQPRWLDQFGYWLAEKTRPVAPSATSASSASAGTTTATAAMAMPAVGAPFGARAVSLASLRAVITAPDPANRSAVGAARAPTATPSADPTPVIQAGRLIAVGAAWGLLPCGFLYSALMLVMIAAEPVSGAVAMAAFALGTAVPLVLAQRWSSLARTATDASDGKAKQGSWRSWAPTLGARLLGAVMVAASLYGIQMLILGDGYRLFCR